MQQQQQSSSLKKIPRVENTTEPYFQVTMRNRDAFIFSVIATFKKQFSLAAYTCASSHVSEQTGLIEFASCPN